MIDQFTKERFEKALPGKWECMGLDRGEYTYNLYPVDSPDGYAINVRSSVGQSGIADESGEDSIRARVVKLENGQWKFYGNKVKRWVSRVNGWEGRLLEMLKSCKALLSRIRPCPKCSEMLIPFTAHKGDNKGRGFVSHGAENSCKFFEWTDEPIKETPQATQGTTASPSCPKCKAMMVRMSKGTGWRCACPGNTWKQIEGKWGWTKCDGVIWDKKNPASEKSPSEKSPMTATENDLIMLLNRATDLLGKITDREKAVKVMASYGILHLDALVCLLIDIGNERQASK